MYCQVVFACEMAFNIIVKMPGAGLFRYIHNLCVCFSLYQDLAAAWAFSSSGEQGLLSSCGVRASHCGGFSCCGAWACSSVAGHVGSTAQAWLLPGMWDLPNPETELTSPALADGFFTTEPPGKPRSWS